MFWQHLSILDRRRSLYPSLVLRRHEGVLRAMPGKRGFKGYAEQAGSCGRFVEACWPVAGFTRRVQCPVLSYNGQGLSER
jgi:hypothetical protein